MRYAIFLWMGISNLINQKSAQNVLFRDHLKTLQIQTNIKQAKLYFKGKMKSPISMKSTVQFQ